MLNTLKTVAGYIYSLVDRMLPFDLSRSSINKIYNYLVYEELELSTSGQPSERQLESIAEAGYQVVLNLGPHNKQNAKFDEALIVSQLGMQYYHLPVDFKRPTETDFEQFVELIEQHSAKTLWVHCVANIRVASFVYRYRCAYLGHHPDKARIELNEIWQPVGVWKRFIGKKSRPSTDCILLGVVLLIFWYK